MFVNFIVAPQRRVFSIQSNQNYNVIDDGTMYIVCGLNADKFLKNLNNNKLVLKERKLNNFMNNKISGKKWL